MKLKRTWPLVVVVVLAVFAAIIVGTAYYLIFPEKPKIKEETIIEVVVRGALDELPSGNSLVQAFLESRLSLWELGKLFESAMYDNRVSGIYLEVHPLSLSWAQVEELRDLIRNFRRTGKPVHAFLVVDMIQEIELYLVCAANSVTANPDAGVLLNGLVTEINFYKKAMDKLRISPQFIQFKEYKSPESYTRKKMSTEIRQMMKSILGDMEQRIIATIARDREIEEKILQKIMLTGVLSAKDALKAGLLDALGQRDNVDFTFVESGHEADRYSWVSANRYLDSVASEYRQQSSHKVALLGGVGLISAGYSGPFREILGGTTMSSYLRKIRNNEELDGVILRVDSPGGSAVGSNMIWKEVKLLGESNKPVVVSMSGVAGSGGYYISMGAGHIVSQPSTITGSIGVKFGKFDIDKFYSWLGIDVDRVKISPNADIFSSFTSLNLKQRRAVELWMTDIYESFVQKAAQGRGLEYKELELRSRGRIYTGAQAKKIGLVDDLGGLQVAISHMKKKLGLSENEEIELVLYPPAKSFWEEFTSGELLGVQQETSFVAWLKEGMRVFSTPAPWLFMPQISVN